MRGKGLEAVGKESCRVCVSLFASVKLAEIQSAVFDLLGDSSGLQRKMWVRMMFIFIKSFVKAF